MTHEDVISKIQNLFNITEQNGASKNEAISAALMAQRLIAKYDIKEDELFVQESYEVVEVESEPVYRKFKIQLATIIAQNYRCRVWIKPEGRKSSAVFVGRSIDANAAALIYNRLYECVNEYANSESIQYRGQGRGLYGNYYNSAAIAFLDGIKAELEKQCKELMLVRPKEVDEQFNKKTKGWKRCNSSLSSFGYVNYEAGVQAGRDAVRAGRLGADSTKKIGA